MVAMNHTHQLHVTPAVPADTSDFAMIHGCLRRATAQIVRAAPSVHAVDHRRARGFQRYWAGFVHELEHHHTVEDDIFYPALAERAPQVREVLEVIEADHHRIDELMEEASAAIAGVTELGTRSTTDVRPFVEFDALLARHLDLEDAELVPLFGQHFEAAEYEALTQRAMKALSMRQATFTVPFVAAQAEPGELADILAKAPLPFRVLLRATRRRHTRLAATALGTHP